ncbi:coiled-coil domain-containing protein 47 [Ditylenchus destructor]|uniref:PAT complex subunit CCDC47 n=1 Tax=Ditylenchus destructor TaxID=166010 RepID=A0AAD4NJ42_9BILA|nr:coiled-coil domain-containing protein 47 [Ditylenchus destructor]
MTLITKFEVIPYPDLADNEFAEFEVADEAFTAEPVAEQAQANFDEITETFSEQPKQEDKSFQNEEDFAFFANDDDEFEDTEKKSEKSDLNMENSDKKSVDIKPLTFADVEAFALVVIILYLVNYIYGKSRNHTIAYNWFMANREHLENQFALVGDDGASPEPTGGHLMKETDYLYSVWCSGRVGCDGMLTQIKLIKRQDLVGFTANFFRPKSDRVIHKIDLERGEMDSFVLIFGNKKSVLRAVKDYEDLSTYVAERKLSDKLVLPSNFTVFAEVAETLSLIDAGTQQFIKKYEKYIEYFYFSDQYSGAKSQEENPTRLPVTSPTLFFSFFLLGDEEEEHVYKNLLNFTFLLVERVRRYRLSKEGKMKADKKRQVVEEMFLKTTHQQRQEAAQARREEKARERKQKVMEEEDPDRQRRLEKIEQKRESKLRQPRMKQFKIK